MQVYQCNLLLHDYLFFATTERGKVAETGPFIHNYALTYALGWARSSRYNEEQRPRYREELALVGKRYITPARLIRGSSIVSQYNTLSESFSMSKERSIGYPDWGFIKCFRPGSLFRCYVISQEEVAFPRYLRLGKFMAKTALQTVRADEVSMQPAIRTPARSRQDEPDSPLLNWNDLSPQARPPVFDLIANSLPSHLIANAAFEERYQLLTATFSSPENKTRSGQKPTVQLPAQMGYYGENICTSW